MRCNQVSISIERFGEYVPKNYPADVQRIHVYCDDFRSIYAALSKAYAMAINELAQYERIGVRTDVYTNEFSRADYREMHGATLDYKTKYEDDVNFQYGDTRMQLCSDFIWAYEHSGEIIDTIKECKDEDGMKIALKERFGLNDYQVRKLSQIRLEMLTEAEYQSSKNEIEQIKASQTESYSFYLKNKRRKAEKEIKRLEAYFTAADHYEEILKFVSDTEEVREFERIMEEKFDFSPDESRMIRYLNVNDFSKKEREHRLERLEWLRKELAGYLKEERCRNALKE